MILIRFLTSLLYSLPIWYLNIMNVNTENIFINYFIPKLFLLWHTKKFQNKIEIVNNESHRSMLYKKRLKIKSWWWRCWTSTRISILIYIYLGVTSTATLRWRRINYNYGTSTIHSSDWIFCLWRITITAATYWWQRWTFNHWWWRTFTNNFPFVLQHRRIAVAATFYNSETRIISFNFKINGILSI